MFFFYVPKGEDDIRMVYDGTKLGLNKSLYAPWLALPTIDTLAQWVFVGSWCADNNYCDIFLNFPLHPALQKYCGIDLIELFPELNPNKAQMVVAAWTQNAMGLYPLPHCSIQSGLVAKRIITGNQKTESNPFHWDHIVQNLPFSKH